MESLRRSPRVCLAFTDSRLAYVGWNALAVSATAEIAPDPSGELFRDELVDQELRKYPPSRVLIGNRLLQRENWWYMPRWIVRFTEPSDPYPLARRTDSHHGVLAWDPPDRDDPEPRAGTVRVEDWDVERVFFKPLHPDSVPPAEGAPAALLHHDFSVPDLEQRSSFLATGRIDNGRLSVSGREGTRDLGGRPGLISRWRSLKDLRKRCKSGLESLE